MNWQLFSATSATLSTSKSHLFPSLLFLCQKSRLFLEGCVKCSHRSYPLAKNDEFDAILPLLQCMMTPIQLMGPFIIYSPYLFTVICRLFASYLQNPTDPSFLPAIGSIYKTILLPSLSMASPNCSMNIEVWYGLKSFSQSDRFEMYVYWQDESITQNPDLMFGLKKNYLAIDYYLRRIAAGNVKEMSRILMFYAYATPLYFFRSFLYKCTTFDNLIKLIVPQLKLSSSLAIDCCVFCILDSLENRKKVLEEDQVTVERGFSLIIEFTAAVIRLLTQRADISLLMRFVEKQLRSGDVTMMLFVSKLISDVANVWHWGLGYG